MTAACLRSLATHSAGQDLEVLVVDNGSTDATVGELEPLGQSLWGAGFKALRLPENLGFAKACNLGAHAAAGDLLFFLNNDTTCTPGWLPPLRAAFEDARLGAAGPLLLYPDGTAQALRHQLLTFLQSQPYLPSIFPATIRTTEKAPFAGHYRRGLDAAAAGI